MKKERIEQVRQAIVNKVMPLSKKAEYARIFECGVAWADDNPQNPWISVEDRLPEEEVNVFVRRDDHFYLYGRLIEGGQWICYGFGTQTDHKITHWMPVPKLPLEG